MPYIGRDLQRGNYLKLDDISSQFNGTTRTFDLRSGGNLFYPGSSFSILVVLGGVIQEPESAYTIDQYQITFASAPGVSDDFFCIALGVALGIGVPGEGTVSTSKIATGAVTFDKLDPDARGVGIQSGGVSIAGAGVTQLNFIGTGNTFTYNPTTKTVNISIQGGSTGAGGTFAANNVGVHTTKILGLSTTNVTGAANSEGALQAFGNVAVIDGALLTDQNIDSNVFVPSGRNGLLIGPVTVGLGITVDIASGSVLVIV
jgi:hypothetical protein